MKLYFTSKIQTEDFVIFFMNRFVYMDDDLFIDYYNREVDLGDTNEPLQMYYFSAMDRIFKRKFGRSPMIMDNDEMSISIIGKVKLTSSDFEFFDQKLNFKENVSKQKTNCEGKIILKVERKNSIKNKN